MTCRYCYYLDKKSLFPNTRRQMDDELLELFIRQRLEASAGPTHFEWHGGEPTLLGLEYFRRIRELQKKYQPNGHIITNGLQTNGILLDERWAGFLSQESFTVGLSLDGPGDLHDAFRTAADRTPTFERVAEAFRLLKKYGVFCTILCVLHSVNTAEPDRVYDFFRGIGASYLQFLPLVVQSIDGNLNSVAAEPAAIGNFLCRIFQRWITEDVGRLVIQNIDEALRPLYGIDHALCIHRPTCGEVPVLEHDGGFYPCDHFVQPDYRIGNLWKKTLVELVRDPQMVRFGSAKREDLPEFCRRCQVLDACNGGCPKDRIAKTPEGEAGLNYLCPAYFTFFTSSRPELSRLAAHMKAGKRLRDFRAITEWLL
jgi:serine-type anaerobic sulfatase-maturating enzyme